MLHITLTRSGAKKVPMVMVRGKNLEDESGKSMGTTIKDPNTPEDIDVSIIDGNWNKITIIAANNVMVKKLPLEKMGGESVKIRFDQ